MYAVPTNDFSGRDGETEEIADGHEAVVPAERVHPDVVGELWVAHRDVAAHAFGEAFARPVAEDGGHVDEDVAPFLGVA